MAVSILLTLLLLTLSLPAWAGQETAKPSSPRPLEIKDILSWKSISSARISADGRWFAYSLTPNEGNSELVVKEIDGTREYRFNLGDAPRNSPLLSSYLTIPAGSLLCLILPLKKLRNCARTKKDRAQSFPARTGQRPENRLAGCAEIAFSEESSLCLAIHRLAPESQEKKKINGPALIWC